MTHKGMNVEIATLAIPCSRHQARWVRLFGTLDNNVRHAG